MSSVYSCPLNDVWEYLLSTLQHQRRSIWKGRNGISYSYMHEHAIALTHMHVPTGEYMHTGMNMWWKQLLKVNTFCTMWWGESNLMHKKKQRNSNTTTHLWWCMGRSSRPFLSRRRIAGQMFSPRTAVYWQQRERKNNQRVKEGVWDRDYGGRQRNPKWFPGPFKPDCLSATFTTSFILWLNHTCGDAWSCGFYVTRQNMIEAKYISLSPYLCGCVCVFHHTFTNEDQMSHKHRKIRTIFHSENISLLLWEFILWLGRGFIVVIRISVEVALG